MSKSVIVDDKNWIKAEGIKKLPLELTRLEGELAEFTHKSMVEPASSSFIPALGIALFESLIRMKSKRFLTESAWKSIQQSLENMKSFASDLRLDKPFNNFLDLVNKLKKSDRTEGKRLIDSTLNNNSNSSDFLTGLKILICSCVDCDYKLIMNNTIDPEPVLFQFCAKICVHIAHFTYGQYKIYKTKNIAPLVCIYSSKSHFGLIYHCSIKYLDEKTDTIGVDFRAFPFLYNPSKKFSPRIALEKDNAQSRFIDVFDILVNNLKPIDSNVRKDLRNNINALKIMCPDIEIRLQEFYDKAISQCGHNTKEYTPVCLQGHCMSCLMDTVLESPNQTVLCPCGVPLDHSDIEFLVSDRTASKVTNTNYRTSSMIPKNNLASALSRKSSIKLSPKNSSRKIKKLPLITSKIVCALCRRGLGNGNFSGVKCKGHVVCLECRSKRVTSSGNQCPICERIYNGDELTVLKMRTKSIDLTSSLLKAKGFIDTL